MLNKNTIFLSKERRPDLLKYDYEPSLWTSAHQQWFNLYGESLKNWQLLNSIMDPYVETINLIFT